MGIFLVKEVKNIMPNIIGLVNQLEGKPKELTKLGDAIRSDLDKLKSKVAMARDLASKLVCRAMLDHLLRCWRVSCCFSHYCQIKFLIQIFFCYFYFFPFIVLYVQYNCKIHLFFCIYLTKQIFVLIISVNGELSY